MNDCCVNIDPCAVKTVFDCSQLLLSSSDFSISIQKIADCSYDLKIGNTDFIPFVLNVGETNSIILSGRSLSYDPLVGDVKISAEDGNNIQILSDGLFVPDILSDLVVEDTTSIDMDFTSGAIRGTVIISEDEDNIISIASDGLLALEEDTLQSVSDRGHVSDRTDIQVAGLGIGKVPDTIFDVLDGTSILSFKNGALEVTDDPDGGRNLRVGLNAGKNLSGNFNVYMGNNCALHADGDHNVGCGPLSLFNIIGSGNTAIGGRTGSHSEGDDNTSLGLSANEESFGSNNTAVGSGANTAFSIYTQSGIPVSTFIVGTPNLSGAAISNIISGAGLVTGQYYVLRLVFTDTPPDPLRNNEAIYYSDKYLVINSNTLELLDHADFINQGTGTYTVDVFNKQDNSIAIGYSVRTLDSNEISIGNVQNDILRINEFVVDIDATPTLNEGIKWDGDKYVPGNSFKTGSFVANGGSDTYIVTHGLGGAPLQVLVTPTSPDAAIASGSPISWRVSNKGGSTFTVKFSTSTDAGTNNVGFDWFAI